MITKVTYITVPVGFDEDGEPTLLLGDDGEPGLWGDTYQYDDGDGDWVFDSDAQIRGQQYLEGLLEDADSYAYGDEV